MSEHTLVGYTESTRNDKLMALNLPQSPTLTRRLLVIGAAHVDDIATPVTPLVPQASNPVSWTRRVGGVAANAARSAASQLPPDSSVGFVAAVGDDTDAVQLEGALKRCAVAPSLVKLKNTNTGRYSAIMDMDGELYLGLADVSVAERLTVNALQAVADLVAVDAILVDANLSEKCLTDIAQVASEHMTPLAALSVSPVKTQRLLCLASTIDLLFCNRREALAMCPELALNDTLERLADGLCALGFKQFVLTDGQSPLIIQQVASRETIAVPGVAQPRSVNGAGDALAGASFAGWAHGQSLRNAVVGRGLVEAENIVTGKRSAPLFT